MSNAFGGGFTFDGLGVKARGMGGAFRALADDWSAAYYNPAGYTQIQDNVISGNVTFMHYRYSAEPNVLWDGQYETGFYNGQELYNHHTILNVPQVGIVMRLPIWDETVFGFSIMQIFDQNHSWELYRNLISYNQSAYPKKQFYNNLDVVAFQITAAREFMDEDLSVGIGLALLRGDLIFNGISLHDNPMPSPISNRPYDKVPQWYHHDGMGWGFGFRAGLIYKVNDKINVALTATGPSSITISGDSKAKYYIGDNVTEHITYFDTTEESYFTGGTVQEVSADFETSLDIPASIAGGVAMKVNDKLTIDLDIEYTLWSAFDGFVFKYSNLSGLPESNFTHANSLMNISELEIPIEWTNSGRVMLGASYKLKDFVELRGGGSVDQTVIKDETFIPQFMDLYTKYSFGVGIGFEINFWHLDLATTYTHHKDVDIGSLAYQNDDNLMDNLPGLYKADDFQTILGISYRF
jgi:long-chain fatty acid transport protein